MGVIWYIIETIAAICSYCFIFNINIRLYPPHPSQIMKFLHNRLVEYMQSAFNVFWETIRENIVSRCQVYIFGYFLI